MLPCLSYFIDLEMLSFLLLFNWRMIEEVTAQPSNFLFIKKIPLEMPEFHVGEAFVIVQSR